jgi:hypothetical protein
MKSKLFLLTAIIFCAQIFYSQTDVYKPRVPPEPIEVDIPDIDFHPFLKMSEKDEKELLKNMKEEIKRELAEIKKVNKEKYYDFLRESQYKNIKSPFMVKREKVMYERENKIFEAEVKAEAIAAKYINARDAERKKLRHDLRAELNTLFEEKEQRRKDEVEELEKQLQELKKSLSIRLKNKEEIINRRIQELLDEDEYLDWD